MVEVGGGWAVARIFLIALSRRRKFVSVGFRSASVCIYYSFVCQWLWVCVILLHPPELFRFHLQSFPCLFLACELKQSYQNTAHIDTRRTGFTLQVHNAGEQRQLCLLPGREHHGASTPSHAHATHTLTHARAHQPLKLMCVHFWYGSTTHLRAATAVIVTNTRMIIQRIIRRPEVHFRKRCFVFR